MAFSLKINDVSQIIKNYIDNQKEEKLQPKLCTFLYLSLNHRGTELSAELQCCSFLVNITLSPGNKLPQSYCISAEVVLLAEVLADVRHHHACI